ncbi:N-acetylmuramoyl-L-alanine amidase AmiC precursor [Jannaschia seosinensis]|uniref:N-acetylmuramoyl-L-alanine amidase n=1 Tax=Jannaschia seosinensis TaxID=313367 RepID=A0A0M7BDW8_9RHOB|nr:N-acetylmuramoyl-L-alanine amidase [Jannaschia seosinensis]CUH40024.1 N-acetylmuramoyl-L-alanine amidase AmiC precursor [Jannaschia seosinensis]
MIRAALLALAMTAPAFAEVATLTGVAADRGWSGANIDLTLDREVPWRVFVEAAPPRLVLDTAEVDWAGLDPAHLSEVGAVRVGRLRPGWSRLVVMLDEPMGVERAWMETGMQGARIRVELWEGEGATGPRVPWVGEVAPDPLPSTPRSRQDGTRPLVVALDPGHGGVDPGAERDGVNEADLMLGFARELAAALRRAGHEVVLTRDDDVFLGLRGRSSVARAAGADLMISLHADAVAGGGAEGATVYTLNETAPDALSAEIVQRQARDDLLLGAVLAEPGDEIARLLVEMARTETAPRSDRLADALVGALGEAGVRLHKRPRLGAAFTVLKAPDIPSVLLELGFMSDPRDLANIRSPQWRARTIEAVVRGVAGWAEADAAEAALLRR